MNDEIEEQDAQDTRNSLGKATRNLAASRNYTQTANEFVWETFDSLFKTVYRQTQRIEEMEARLIELEKRVALAPAGQQIDVIEIAHSKEPRCAECNKLESEEEGGLITFFRPGSLDG